MGISRVNTIIYFVIGMCAASLMKIAIIIGQHGAKNGGGEYDSDIYTLVEIGRYRDKPLMSGYDSTRNMLQDSIQRFEQSRVIRRQDVVDRKNELTLQEKISFTDLDWLLCGLQDNGKGNSRYGWVKCEMWRDCIKARSRSLSVLAISGGYSYPYEKVLIKSYLQKINGAYN